MKNVKQSRCVIGIKGQVPDPDYPIDIWFDLLKSVASVLSKENKQLLKVITEQPPIGDLAGIAYRTGSQ
ncbi:hypothetical protein WNY98_10375 [Pseudoalteromonas sp. AS71]|uniref:hypothetical protein n=1 Tax=Pseudoalteromonas sp. AS71 TaxID=3135777 RepID=UPI0031823AE0